MDDVASESSNAAGRPQDGPAFEAFLDALHKAGQQLGPIESEMAAPHVTFEELQQRAEDVARRIGRRERRDRVKIRALAICVALLTLALSFCVVKSHRKLQ
jgi:hypothetical protein